MRLALLVLLALSAPLAAQTPSALARDSVLAVPPTTRYGLAWGDPPDAVVGRMGRPPDADVPEGSLTYLARNGVGQDIFMFTAGRLSSVVQATGVMTRLDDALAEYDRYKAAFIARYGAPVSEDEPRPGTSPPVVDTGWVPGGDIRAVELTLDFVTGESGASFPFFYVRTLGREPSAR